MDWSTAYIHTALNVPPPLVANARASLPRHSSVLDRVVLEIVIAAESGGTHPDLVTLFLESRSPVLTALFARYSSSPNARLAVTGMHGLILAGDYAPIPEAQKNYRQLSTTNEWPTLMREIQTHFVSADPRAIHALGAVAVDSSNALDLRVAAAGALERIHTKEALPYLAALLDDRDPLIRIFAYDGLSSFANSEIAPGRLAISHQ